MPFIDSARFFPFRTYTEAFLTILVFPLAWLVYVTSTPWRSLEDAIAAPASVVALWLLAEPLCAVGRSRGWLPRDPLFLRLVLRPSAVGYGVATSIAVLFGVGRGLVRLLSTGTGLSQ